MRYYLLIILFPCSLVFSQDIHYSQFWAHQVFQNPGAIGNFDGDFRFGGIQRFQHKSVSKAYITTGLSGEYKGFVEDKLSVGANLFHDVSGTSSLRTFELQLGASYRLDFHKEHSASFGAMIGFNSRFVDYSKLTFDEQYNGNEFDPSITISENFQRDSRWNPQASLGVLYKFQRTKRFWLDFGVGAFNLIGVNQGFMGIDQVRPRRFDITTYGSFQLNKEWDVLPGVYVSLQQKYSEYVFGGQVRYWMKINRVDMLGIRAGLHYRVLDAIALNIGGDYKAWDFGVSYDLNTSKLTQASNLRGGLELYVNYVLKIYKPERKKYRVCPDYY